MDGGSFTTCGDYNGGSGNYMCTGTQPWCQYTLVFFNADRRIFQGVNAECPPSFHSSPWGNFGVDSPYGSRQDSDQFEGWKDIQEGHLEWNACLSDFPPPDSSYYNANQYHETGL